jgi:D-xylose transport system permease protein
LSTAPEAAGRAATARSDRHARGWKRLGRVAVVRATGVLGLALIWALFQIANPRFLSPVNLTNLMLQIVALGTITIGVVLVLLIGEIDLSVGAVSGLCAGVTAVLTVKHGIPAGPAILACLAAGAAIGLFQGALVTRVGLPSLVVTLAGLLAWQGALFAVLGETGTVNIEDRTLVALAGTFLSATAGWAIAGIVVAVYAGVAARPRSGGTRPRRQIAMRIAALAVVAGIAVAVFNADRGVPLAVLVFLGIVVGTQGLITRTSFGREAVAIGSNRTVARRTGIPVNRVRLAVFSLASLLAAAGGILGASRLLAVNQTSGSTDLALSAVAAAAIGGASLYGGRGSAWSALVGALVIGSMANGMDLLGVPVAARFVASAIVLLVAVGLDTISRRRAGEPHI